MNEKWILVNKETGKRIPGTPIYESQEQAKTAIPTILKESNTAPQPPVEARQHLEG